MNQSSRINIDLMKDFNKKLVLRTIQRETLLSRADIASIIELSRPSVSEIVTQLIDEGWVDESVPSKKVRGRTPRPLQINPTNKLIIGIEIGAYTIKMVVCNFRAEVIDSYEVTINSLMEPEEVIKTIATRVNQFKKDFACINKEIVGVGIGMHGLVDSHAGIGLYAPKLGWENVHLKSTFEELTGLPVEVENDCNSSALAEMWFGHGKDENNFISIILDYGIGASIINQGKIFKGAHHVSGQIGHITVDPDGPKCSCGNYGCLENLTSEPAILKTVKRKLKFGEKSTLSENNKDIDSITIDDFYNAVEANDSFAVGIAENVARLLGLGFVVLINLFGPRFIVVGGGLAKIASYLIPTIKEVILFKALGDKAKNTPIFQSVLGENLYTIGAASLIVEKEFSLPTLFK